jgi:hypothetical protein
MVRDHDAVGGEIKEAIPFMIREIFDEDRPCGMGSKLMWGCSGKVGVASTPKDPKMLIDRRCVV